MSIGEVSAIARPARVAPLLVAVIAYAGLAAVLWPASYLGMLGHYQREIVAFACLLPIGVPVAAVLASPPGSRIRFMTDLVRRSGLRLLLVAGCVWIGLAAFTTYKSAIPDIIPFYADPVFADIDAFLHGGFDPGVLAHWLVPDWAAWPLGWLYGPVWFLQWFGFITFIALQGNDALRWRYFTTLAAAICLLGTVSALLLSSVGPVFYERVYGSDRFAGLMASVAASTVGDYMSMASGYLFENYTSRTTAMGTGISAMPSMHMAIVTLNALMLTRLNRWAGTAGWIYLAAILVGSVFLGWHYAIDGYYSMLVVGMAWWVAGRIYEPRPKVAA